LRLLSRENGSFLCESTNRVKSDHDVNRHAEVVALSIAQLVRGMNLSDCTIYSTVEPCAQCSYAIREARIGRVVYGHKISPYGWTLPMEHPLGHGFVVIAPRGFSTSARDHVGFLRGEVETLFQQWKPLIWQVIQKRGIFAANAGESSSTKTPPAGGFEASLTRLLKTRLMGRIRQI
jgi:tRNA(adenine34) deaminase